jgi:pimeloyl-ACP methyl ester carboxylesterase
MNTLTSADGTTIAYERAGSGPAIVFVAGAFNDHSALAPLAGALAGDFTVVTYDRRARGASGNTKPWSIDREAEDLDALIAETGGSAHVFGFSSGAILALHAITRGSAVSRLVCYEPPYPFGAGNAADLPRPSGCRPRWWRSCAARRCSRRWRRWRRAWSTTRRSRPAPRRPRR